MVLQGLHFRRKGIGRDDDEVAALDLVLDGIGHLLIRLRRKQRPPAFQHEAVKVGIGRQRVGEHLVGRGRVVVGVERAAADFRPAVLAGEGLGVLLAGERVAGSSGTLVDVGGRRIAEQQADIAALGLQLLQLLRELLAEFVLVRPDIGGAQIAVLVEEVGIGGDDRDRRLAPPQHLRDRRRVRRRDGHGGDALGQEIVDDLDFTRLVGRRRGAGVIALESLVLQLLGRLLASLVHQVEIGVVETLHDQRERLRLLRHREAGRSREQRGRQTEHVSFHSNFLPVAARR